MLRSYWMQNAMNSGEWSPRMKGRSDLPKYQHACRTLENNVAFKQGGYFRRPGTLYVHEVLDSTAAAIVIPWETNYGNYILEFGDATLRIIDVSDRSTYASVSSPYAATDLSTLQWWPVDDNTIYFAHGSYAPRKLVKTASSYSWGNIAYTWGPWDLGDFAQTIGVTVTSDGTTGSVTVTSSGTIFSSTDVGRNFKIGSGYVTIDSFTSTSEVDCTVVQTVATDATNDWAFDIWNATNGWPKAVTTHQQRVVFGGSALRPTTLWSTVTGSLTNFDIGDSTAAYGYTFRLREGREIKWLFGERDLFVGCRDAVLPLDTGNGDAISPANPPRERRELHYGASAERPVAAQGALLFTPSVGRSLREITFDDLQQSYVAPDKTLYASHIGQNGIHGLVHQREQDSVVWAHDDDGVLIGMTYERLNDIWAWHRHPMTNGTVESKAVIPHPDGDRDQVWMIVNRTISGSTVRYVEILEEKSGYYDRLTVDSGVVYSGSATATITGLDHLEGQTVDILGDGLVYATQTVSSGQVTGLDPTVSDAEVGLHFTSTFEPMSPEAPTRAGSPQGRVKKITDVIVRVINTIGLTVDGDMDDFHEADDLLDETTGLYSGDRRVPAPASGWDRDAVPTIQQTQPLPQSVVAVMLNISVSEGA